MRKAILLILLFSGFWNGHIFAQSVGIGTSSPNASAQLDVSSTSKGFLPPRMTAMQRKAIASPANGLVVFDTDANQLYVYDGTVWQALAGGSSGNILYPPQTLQPAADRSFKGYFGMDVAIWGNYAVVGAPNADSNTQKSTGCVHVFKKGTSGAWVQVAKMYASDLKAGSYFGSSVAIAGNYIVAGASEWATGTNYSLGKVYVFAKGSGDTWTQQTSFTQPGGGADGSGFGYYLSISITSAFGPAIIVGAPSSPGGGNSRGAAYVYRFSGGSWNLQQALTPNDLADYDYFGGDVDIDGDYCVVGAPFQYSAEYNTAATGTAYIYVFGGGVWNNQQKVSGLTTNAGFGYAVSLQNNLLAVGAPRQPVYAGTTSGVYLFQRTLATWSQLAQPLYFSAASGFDEYSYFGQSIALDSNNLFIGIPGGVKFHSLGSIGGGLNTGVAVYKKYSNGSNFYLTKILHDEAPLPDQQYGNFFGSAISSKNGRYIIGIPTKTAGEIRDAGAVSFGFIE
jgi:hypothetical protein